MVSWLSRQTSLPVHIAQDGERLQSGTILVADTLMQLVFKDRQHLGYAARSELSPHQPCIDLFFESAAPFHFNHLVAMILTGMGRDGARGLKMLRSAGATTIAQDAGSSVVYGMPKAAAEAGAVKEVLPLEAIAPRLISIFSRK
jgi:chemotaxis response regulator CheB